MIPRISKILYATDLSKNSAYAFRYAVNTAEKHNAKITILYVLAPSRFVVELDFLTDEARMFANAEQTQADKIKGRLEGVIQKEQKDRPESLANRIAGIEILEGDPADTIMQKAEDMNADVLIMGTHSKGLIAQAFLGSVASQVLQQIRIPVFIIPIPKETDIAFND